MQRLYEDTSSVNPTISVWETDELYGERGVFRTLQFSGQAIQGAMDMGRPERIVFEYPRAMLHLMAANCPAYEHVFIIGHGIGTLGRHLADKRVKIAELDDTVVRLSREYFGYNLNQVIVGDGRLLLAAEKPLTYDVILLDAFNEKGTPPHLTSLEFFHLTAAKLDSQGILVLNLLTRGGHDPVIETIHNTLAKVYSHTQAFVLQTKGAGSLKNLLLVARNQPIVYQARQMAGFVQV